MKKEKIFKGISAGVFSILYFISGYLGLAACNLAIDTGESSVGFIGVSLAVLFVISLLVMTFAFSGSKTYLILFSVYFGLLFSSIAIEFTDRYLFEVSIRVFNDLVLNALLTFALPVANLTGNRYFLSAFTIMGFEKDTIITIIIFGVIIALFYVSYFALRPLKRKLFSVKAPEKASDQHSKKDVIINIVSVALVLILYFVASLFVANGFPAYITFSNPGAIFSFAFVVALYFMTYRFSISKTYLVLFSIYFGLMIISPIVSRIIISVIPDYAASIVLALGVNLYSFIFPIYQWILAVEKAVILVGLPISETVVYIGMVLITIALFYVTYFVSRRIKKIKAEKAKAIENVDITVE